ncbi:MAG: VWA domain-containing protein [Roseovarius sp.]|nr:VWA domain-containing protein [Roseovarius sp.]
MAGVTRFPARATGPADRMVGFIAHLRLNGMSLGVGETATAMAALAEINTTHPDEARLALRAVCAGTAEEAARFDDLFAAYWKNRGLEREGTTAGDTALRNPEHQRSPYVSAALSALRAGSSEQPDPEMDGEAEHGDDGHLVGSRIANMMRTDLREMMTPEQIAAAQTTAERIARAIRDRRSRRRKAAKRRGRLDMRRIARRSVATGGEPLHLHFKHRPDRPGNIVALLDVSGSMTVYARVFLSFIKGLIGADPRADAYLFHTRLVRITDALRDNDPMRAVNRLSLMAQGFGGGTRIGGNLATFNRGYARARVNGRSVVIILSDGYDTDPPELLDRELAALKRRGCRVLWLNPLKGWAGYAPVARGMAAALPHLDLFAVANTLESLATLEQELARI